MTWLISLAFLTILVAFLYFWHSIKKPLDFKKDIYVIERGQPLQKVAEMLVNKGVIDHPYDLRLLARFRGDGHKIQYGEYQFPSGINLDQFLSHLINAKGQILMSLTVIEGWTFKQFRQEIERAPKLKQTMLGLHDKDVMQRLDHPDEHPEGRFYPSTYYYKKDDSDLMLLKQAYELMEKKLNRAWELRSEDTMLKDPYQALILASIIEKEAKIDSEREIMAGVFNNRLRLGRRLETDPTVIYGIGDSYKGDITYKHLRTDTAYNTYTRKGLPPTPIALPRYASILAAVRPGKTKALFFVATGDDGVHHFSESYKEHSRAVNRYQK